VGKAVANVVPKMKILGDAQEVKDIFSTIRAGYELALRY